ncbi:MAG: hypothetical protein A2901_06635 [Elusimicrobia bacterium RIFCSPLOWO2_01_FULL_54_10]|nr:MAG: hypothetical protein A2901_06635 [Elusimicrobia bacterium RIFCSPLOWO2_01_FULL_54_10]
MRLTFAVFAALLALSLLSPDPSFSKGKKPQQSEYDDAYDEQAPLEEPAEPQQDIIEPSAKPESGESSAFEPQPPSSESAPAVEETFQETRPPQAAVKEAPVQIPEGGVLHVVWIWQETKDCLWNLAKKHYKDPWQWKQIYIANRNSILNPNVIFPKQKIVVPPLQPAVQ